jgi:HSP20 family protein
MSTTWNPIPELDAVRGQLDRLVSQVWRPATEARLLPPVEVFTDRTRRQVVVQVELPGLDPADLTVELADEMAYISGERRRFGEIREEDCYRAERRYGRFERGIPLPHRIDAPRARARYHAGVLVLEAPMAEVPARPPLHRVPVEV